MEMQTGAGVHVAALTLDCGPARGIPRGFSHSRAGLSLTGAWALGLLFADALLTKSKLKRKRAELFDFFPALLRVLDISLQ